MDKDVGIFETLSELMRRVSIVEPLYWESAIRTGIDSLDAKIGGFRPGDLVILASEHPWVHPQLLQVFIEATAVNQKLAVAIIRLGKSERDWCSQLFISKAASPRSWGSDEYNNPEPNWDRLHDLIEAPIYFTRSVTGVGIDYLEQELGKLSHAIGKLGMIVIDGIDHLNIWSDPAFNAGNPGRTWSLVSSKLKWIATNLKCPVIIDSKITNKHPEIGDLSNPTWRDLSYEGAITNSADIVLILQEFSHLPDGLAAKLCADFNRHGFGAHIDLHYLNETGTWIDPMISLHRVLREKNTPF